MGIVAVKTHLGEALEDTVEVDEREDVAGLGTAHVVADAGHKIRQRDRWDAS